MYALAQPMSSLQNLVMGGARITYGAQLLWEQVHSATHQAGCIRHGHGCTFAEICRTCLHGAQHLGQCLKLSIEHCSL